MVSQPLAPPQSAAPLRSQEERTRVETVSPHLCPSLLGGRAERGCKQEGPPYYDLGMGMVFPLKTQQGIQFGQGPPDVGAGQFMLHQLHVGVNRQGQLTAYYWTHSPFSTLDLLNWKSQNPSCQDDPKKTYSLICQFRSQGPWEYIAGQSGWHQAKAK